MKHHLMTQFVDWVSPNTFHEKMEKKKKPSRKHCQEMTWLQVKPMVHLEEKAGSNDSTEHMHSLITVL